MKSVCVYCGSAIGAQPVYAEAAEELGEELVRRELKLVYGGAGVGLMGKVADTVIAGNGKVTGVMPRNLFRNEVPHNDLPDMIHVDSMHERKALMADLADCFIAMPGGLGTIEELFEILTWSQLKIHQKPCGILNVSGYYDGLLEFMDHCVDQKFIRTQHRDMLFVESDPATLLDRCEKFQPVDVQKWVDLESTAG